MSGDRSSWRRCYVLADVIIFLYEVPRIFWYYINVDEVSRITLKKLLQSAMELLQIATAQFTTKCDGLLLQIATAFFLQSATRSITNCYRYYKLQWIYYKLRQVLQSAMIITNCDSKVPFLVCLFFNRTTLSIVNKKHLLPCMTYRVEIFPKNVCKLS